MKLNKIKLSRFFLVQTIHLTRHLWEPGPTAQNCLFKSRSFNRRTFFELFSYEMSFTNGADTRATEVSMGLLGRYLRGSHPELTEEQRLTAGTRVADFIAQFFRRHYRENPDWDGISPITGLTFGDDIDEMGGEVYRNMVLGHMLNGLDEEDIQRETQEVLSLPPTQEREEFVSLLPCCFFYLR